MTEPRQRAWRILRQLERYEGLEEGAPPPDDLSASGDMLGVYKNEDGSKLYVTDTGIYTNGRGSFDYAQVLSSEVIGEKTAAEEILVRTRDGGSIRVRVDGGSGRFRDVWEFKRYLDRVSGDLSAT